ncbi:MAG TPA: (deoxy)nucleoside triphosphate pyrophosphohydrolase [Thermoplasmatales archaeon]|nr:(deoxy)nucleoside triphosphate pyrophosphohydrolase [Thermoplasmatales archaeon]
MFKIPHYEVTAAIIYHQGKILVTTRPKHEIYGGLWEFPGGKREKNETLEECLKREIKEELGIEISIVRFFTKVSHSYPNFSITLYAFICDYKGGKLTPMSTVKYLWADIKELEKMPFLEADKKIIKKLIDILHSEENMLK